MRKFIRGNGAGATVEFALLIPAVLLIIVFVVETSRLHMAGMILERSLYDIAYQVRIGRGAGLAAAGEEILKRNSHGLYDVSDVTLTAMSARNMAAFGNGEIAGTSGAPGELVRLELTANLSFLGTLLPEGPKIARFAMVTYFVNEPDY